MRSFRDYYEHKVRQSIKQLNLVRQVMERGGFKVDNFLEEHFNDPYLFIYNPNKNTSFTGIRIYKIGDKIAYRIQRENKTHPYGNAYTLDIELMFDDLLEDGNTPEKAGTKLIDMIIKEVRAFFEESSDAEHEGNDWFDDDKKKSNLGSIQVRSSLTGAMDNLAQGAT